jgi:hypothetical protein
MTKDIVEKIVEHIDNLNDKVKSIFPYDNYVIDVQIDENFKTELVEINTFYLSGSAFFSYQDR